MSDDSVRAALRSSASLVVVEAPAGCGKTHQGANYARELAPNIGPGRLLILTHTHAACSVFGERTKGSHSQVEVRTIDSLIGNIGTAYHAGLGLPADVGSWARLRKDGHGELAAKVAALLRRHPMIAAAAAHRYPVVICDEHQDSSGDQHAIVMSMREFGTKVRVFADPMQKIYRDKMLGSAPPYEWSALTSAAEVYDELDTAHRWADGCSELGKWTLRARELLKSGGSIDLRSGLPPSVNVVIAENQARAPMDYQLSSVDRKPIDAFEKSQASLLILTRYNDTSRSLRPFFSRRILLWEGHTRPGLEKLLNALRAGDGNREGLALALVEFMGNVGKGFSASAFGNSLVQEVREGCVKRRSGKPAAIQELARFLVAEPDHRGASKMLRRLSELRVTHSQFADIETDAHKEFWDAIRLGEFDTADSGFAEITHRRTYSRPRPPDKAISTIHKAKGLECSGVIVMPCDARTFPDKPDARCLLYVALSRAKNRLQIVASRANPSPLLLM